MASGILRPASYNWYCHTYVMILQRQQVPLQLQATVNSLLSDEVLSERVWPAIAHGCSAAPPSDSTPVEVYTVR
jgi:hypothetical protein